ncbi:MAG: hypothetical protein ACTSPB_22950 [Candidatus Thorarchaeota archaeon]
MNVVASESSVRLVEPAFSFDAREFSKSDGVGCSVHVLNHVSCVSDGFCLCEVVIGDEHEAFLKSFIKKKGYDLMVNG